MRNGIVTLLVVSAALITLSGCAASLKPTDKVATDYNRVFAQSRNEVLLLNILRAAHGEPLQFSTINNVSGALRSQGSVQIPFTNILLGGDASINPTVTLSGGPNPTIGIIPLSSKEFTTGILRPISPDTLDLFLGQGRDRELILPLALGGVKCADQVLIIRGYAEWVVDDVLRIASKAEGFDISGGKGSPTARVELPAKDAMTFLKEGVGEGWAVSIPSNTTKEGDPLPADLSVKEKLVLELASREGPAFVEFGLEEVCAKHLGSVDKNLYAPQINAFKAQAEQPRPTTTARPAAAGGKEARKDAPERLEVVMRSPAAIIQFLGELLRTNQPDSFIACEVPGLELRPPARHSERARAVGRWQLVEIYRCEGPAPAGAAVVTRFRGQTYYVPGNATRTLEALGFLSDLIALQTSESTIAAGRPIIAIQQP